MSNLNSSITRIASRHMPKLKHRVPGAAAWILLCLLITSTAYVALSQPKLLLVASGALTVMFLLARLLGKRQERSMHMLASTREGQSICEFAKDFDTRALDTWIIRATYEQLQDQLKHVHPAFPVRAGDRLKEDLFIDDDDLDMCLALEVEERTGRSLEGCTTNPYFGKVKTVCDFVMFFQSQPRSGGVA